MNAEILKPQRKWRGETSGGEHYYQLFLFDVLSFTVKLRHNVTVFNFTLIHYSITYSGILNLSLHFLCLYNLSSVMQFNFTAFDFTIF